MRKGKVKGKEYKNKSENNKNIDKRRKPKDMKAR